ncbi:hypothetical protein [Streptomyces sp. NPDC003077]|uniref:helix-turn-helix domain-containing protein n=1 Tax=Streptomyces sp. NPDC003077 TaxID=3154443 RepID=UPI0033B59A12
MKRPLAGRPLGRTKPGPEPVMYLVLYIGALRKAHDITYADVARFMGLEYRKRRDISRAFAGGRQVPKWEYVEATVRCCCGSGAEAEWRLRHCADLHARALAGRESPDVAPDEVRVELAPWVWGRAG